jgi:DNA-binding PadR family transcriptional regulator
MSSRISEMEGAVLGLIWANPGTPYQVRRIMQHSPNPTWSGSAGAIYPLFQRLERRGFLAARRIKTGERKGTVYSISKDGKRTLQQWIAPPLSRTTIGVPVDPLRTRARFLGILPSDDRQRFLEDAIGRLHQHIAVIRADCRNRKASGDVFSYFTARGALLSCSARLRWLLEMRHAIAQWQPVMSDVRTASGRKPYRSQAARSEF